MRALYLVVLAGCSTHTQTLPDGACAVEGITGTIPGVTLAIRADSCVFQRGSGGRFTYEVTATADAPAIPVPDSGGGCSECSVYSADPISFTDYRIGGTSAGGESQQYCLCDQGCCAPTLEHMVELDAMTSTRSFMWSGRTWSGPSDTGNPMGDFFLPGRYDVLVGFSGFAAGSVSATLPIEIID
jgi:hypothetical protein